MPPSTPNRVLRHIPPLRLDQFEKPRIEGNRSFPVRAAWYVLNAVLFNSTIPALIPSSAKATLLRLFGAKVGRGLVCKPRVSIKYPWFLEIGDHVWVGENVWIDNLCTVSIGSNVCISQGVTIFTGNHDWSTPKFSFFASPVRIGDSSWITAHQVLQPGTVIPPSVVVLKAVAESPAVPSAECVESGR